MTFKLMRMGSFSPPGENAEVTSPKTLFFFTNQMGKDEKVEEDEGTRALLYAAPGSISGHGYNLWRHAGKRDQSFTWLLVDPKSPLLGICSRQQTISKTIFCNIVYSIKEWETT